MPKKGKPAVAQETSVRQYTIERPGEDPLSIQVGDTVLLRPPNDDVLDYVARVESIAVGKKDVKVKTRWYYRPEESMGGRRNFHGEKELFLSDHFDSCSADSIMGLCHVYTFRQYVKLETVEDDDYFCRFEYRAATGTFKPDYVAVYCKCEMPYNPDELMVQCDACKDWFHPKCIELSPDEAKELKGYVCEECQKDGREAKAGKEAEGGEGDGEVEEGKEEDEVTSPASSNSKSATATSVTQAKLRRPAKKAKR